MYFNKIPTILYQFDIGNTETLKPVRDITYNVRFRKEVLENITLYDEYDIQEGETPEIIAAKYYGSSEYHWVIMLFNERYDYRTDFPLDQRALNQYVESKYEFPYAIHHYETEDGLVVMSDHPGAVEVTNYDFEQQVNESKRRIKLISPQLLGQILSEYNVV